MITDVLLWSGVTGGCIEVTQVSGFVTRRGCEWCSFWPLDDLSWFWWARTHNTVTLGAIHCVRQRSSTIQLLHQTDICRDQLLLVPAACDLKPLLLMCRSLTRSSRSIHLLLIPCHHRSLNADPCKVHARTHLVRPLLCRVHRRFLLGLSERNDYHTSVSTCHWALPESAMFLSCTQTLTFTDSSIGCFMLMQIVGGCLRVALCVCLHPVFVSVQYINSWYIFFLHAQSQLQLVSFVS